MAQKLVLVGGTGGLGLEVAKGLRSAEGFSSYLALVRPGSSDDKTSKLKEIGWSTEEVNFDEPEALAKALEGTKVVVSTLGGASMVEAEKSVIDAAKAAGVSLFVPSQFGVDYRRWKGSFPFFMGKRSVLQHAKEAGLPTLSVFVGGFSDWIFSFLTDLDNMTVQVVDEGSAKYSFTRRSDIGYVLAKALADPIYSEGGFLSMQGDCMTYREALALIEKITGKTFEVTYLTEEEAKDKENELLGKGDMGSLFGAFALHLLGEPARGSEGFDLSKDAVSYGIKLESLEETLKQVLK